MKLKDRVIEVLSPYEWRTVLEINTLVVDAAIEQNDWGPVSFLISFFSRETAKQWMHLNGPLPSLYGVLAHLEEQKLVEKRFRMISPEKLKLRNGVLPPEYRLTEDGTRARTDEVSLSAFDLGFAV